MLDMCLYLIQQSYQRTASMLVNTTATHIAFGRTIPKILKLCPAARNTYVMIVTTDLFDEEKLMHIDHRGKVLWQRTYKEAVDTFALLSDSEVIVLNASKSQIQIIELLSGSYNIRTHPHELTFADTSSLELLTFYETRFVCLQETGLINEGKLILTYYRYEAHSFEMASQFRSQEGEFTYGNAVSKIDKHSKVAWWGRDFTEEVVFSFWGLHKKAGGELTTIKVRNSLSNLWGLNEVTLNLAELWETEPGVFMLAGHSNAVTAGAFREQYILDTHSGIIRKAKLTLSIPQQSSIVQIFNLGDFSAFFSQNYRAKENRPANIVYVDNRQERMVFVDQWLASSKSHFFLPGYDPNLIVEAIHENGEVEEVTVRAKRLMTVGEMYLHMLLGVNEDFDDDLLQDALQTLGVV